MTTNRSDTCRMCHRVHGVDGWNPRHPFVTADGPTGSLPKKEKDDKKNPPPAPTAAWPFDPVLRQALIDAEVITPQDLRNAEEKIRTITSATMGNLTAPLTGVEVRNGPE